MSFAENKNPYYEKENPNQAIRYEPNNLALSIPSSFGSRTDYGNQDKSDPSASQVTKPELSSRSATSNGITSINNKHLPANFQKLLDLEKALSSQKVSQLQQEIDDL